MSEWAEILNVTTSLITTLATLGMLAIACLALRTWRKEFIGTKKIELARQIMDAVCEVQDTLIYARMSCSNELEIKEVEKSLKTSQAHAPEHTRIYPDRFPFMIPHWRMNERQDKIDAFKNLANKAYLYWGKEIFKLFYELGEYPLQVRIASKNLYYNDTQRNPDDLMKIIFSTGSHDPIAEGIKDIVEEFRINLEPIYKDQCTPWKKLKKTKDDNI
jgi:hypothetical protein